VNACTKGLWLWKKVLRTTNPECPPILLLDSEGLGATDQDATYDNKIFLLSLLLSSFLIYNSLGTIDETALNNLSTAVQLVKKLRLKED
jgi:hypothetical protein